jgi:hypothetical protein
MQSEITKKLTVDLDKRKSVLIEGLVGGVYGEKYRKRIEDVVNSIFFCVFNLINAV